MMIDELLRDMKKQRRRQIFACFAKNALALFTIMGSELAVLLIVLAILRYQMIWYPGSDFIFAEYILLALLVTSIAYAIFAVSRQTWSLSKVARNLDNEHGLHDCLATACYLATNEKQQGFAEVVFEQAKQQLRRSMRTSYKISGKYPLLAAILLVSSLFLWYTAPLVKANASDTPAEQQNTVADNSTEQKKQQTTREETEKQRQSRQKQQKREDKEQRQQQAKGKGNSKQQQSSANNQGGQKNSQNQPSPKQQKNRPPQQRQPKQEQQQQPPQQKEQPQKNANKKSGGQNKQGGDNSAPPQQERYTEREIAPLFDSSGTAQSFQHAIPEFKWAEEGDKLPPDFSSLSPEQKRAFAAKKTIPAADRAAVGRYFHMIRAK